MEWLEEGTREPKVAAADPIGHEACIFCAKNRVTCGYPMGLLGKNCYFLARICGFWKKLPLQIDLYGRLAHHPYKSEIYRDDWVAAAGQTVPKLKMVRSHPYKSLS